MLDPQVHVANKEKARPEKPIGLLKSSLEASKTVDRPGYVFHAMHARVLIL
jgi:hypothetical protein